MNETPESGHTPLPTWDHYAQEHVDPMADALQWIADNYENVNLNHVDFRVEAKRRADNALSQAGGE